MTAEIPAPTDCRTSAVAVLVLLGGVALRLTGLGVHSLWYDEAASLAVATAEDPFALLRTDRHPPLFFLLLRLEAGLVGDDDAMLRLLPALLGCASLLAMHVVARRLLRPSAALLATALFAAAPLQVWYAQELRMYSALELGSLLALLGATSHGSDAVRAVWLFTGATVAMGSHYFGFLVPAIAAPFVLADRARRSRGTAALPLAAAVAGVLAWAPWLFWVLPSQLHTPWAFQARTRLADLIELPARMFVVVGRAMPTWLPFAIAALVALGLAAATVVAWRGGRTARRTIAALAAAAASLALAFTVLPTNLQAFYLIGLSPLVTLLVALGLDAAGAPHLRNVPGIALVALCLGGTLTLRLENRKEDYRSTVAEIADAFRPGDLVVAVTGTPEALSRAGLCHYLRDHPEALAAVRAPSEVAAELRAPGRVHALFRDRPYAHGELDFLRRTFEQVHGGARRVRIQHLTFAVRR